MSSTPFYKLLLDQAKGKTKSLMKFIAFISEDEPDLIKDYDASKNKLDNFRADMGVRDESISSYKSQRGIPLELSQELIEFYSLNEEVAFSRLEELKMDRDACLQEKEAPLTTSTKFNFDDPLAMMPELDELDELEDMDGLDSLPNLGNLSNLGEPKPDKCGFKEAFGFAKEPREAKDEGDEEMPDSIPCLLKQNTSDIVSEPRFGRKPTLGGLSYVHEAAEEEENKSEFPGLGVLSQSSINDLNFGASLNLKSSISNCGSSTQKSCIPQ